jgi:hypothetical protein
VTQLAARRIVVKVAKAGVHSVLGSVLYIKLGVRTRTAATSYFLGLLDERASAVHPAEACQLS